MNLWIRNEALGCLWSVPVLECELQCMVMMAVGVSVWDKGGSENIPQSQGFAMIQAP